LSFHGRNRGGGSGHGQRLWPVLLLLVAAAVVPAACVLWFMNEAMRNERLAVRQRLIDAYRGQLQPLQASLDTFWEERVRSLSTAAGETDAGRAFENVVLAGQFDSIVLLDTTGAVRYPVAADVTAAEPASEDWQEAVRLEHEENQPEVAAILYGQLAATADNADAVAQAMQAQARCLFKAGRRDAGLEVLNRMMADDRLATARDGQGRLIVPNTMLLALDMIGEPSAAGYQDIVDRLASRAGDYGRIDMPSVQRIFLMDALRQMAPGIDFPTLASERLAQEYLAAEPVRPQPGRLTPTALPEVWQMAPEEAGTVGLLRGPQMLAGMRAHLNGPGSLPNATIRLAPRDEAIAPEPLVSIPASRYLSDWVLAVSLDGPDPFSTAAERRIANYLWAGILVSISMVLLAGFVARYVGQQVRLTRLKNDLIATVSHELKTPLSSIRALVDTLLADGAGQQQTREYLELIARENARLSRLIDNFLTFSRMERNRHAFDFAPVAPAAIAKTAVEAVRERFEAAGCDIDLEVSPGLSDIVVDRDAIVVVLLNLLDNAYKYTGPDKQIGLSVFEHDGLTCFAARDNGIGLSRRSVRKVFRQFYQVDQSLSRRAGGCGLGLSIVKFIVDAHSGTVDVRSQPGRGSTFTVKIPTERTTHDK
jgi:signal transduction histidine kinase